MTDNLKLSESEIREIWKLFDEYDRDGDGVVTPEEFTTAYRSRGQEYFVDMVPDVMRAVDRNRSGNVNLWEFVVAAEQKTWRRVEETWEAFRMSDADKDGLLDPDEIKDFTMEHFDINDDGKIDRDEFAHVIH